MQKPNTWESNSCVKKEEAVERREALDKNSDEMKFNTYWCAVLQMKKKKEEEKQEEKKGQDGGISGASLRDARQLSAVRDESTEEEPALLRRPVTGQ